MSKVYLVIHHIDLGYQVMGASLSEDTAKDLLAKKIDDDVGKMVKSKMEPAIAKRIAEARYEIEVHDLA